MKPINSTAQCPKVGSSTGSDSRAPRSVAPFRRLLASSFFLIGSGVASAGVVLDFNSLTNTSTSAEGFVGVGSPYLEDGFSVTGLSGATNASFLAWASTSSRNADLGAATLSDAFNGMTNRLAKTGGSAFKFNSIQLADVYNDALGGNVQTVEFTFVLSAGGTTTTSVTTDGTPGLQTFSFNDVGDVSSVSWLAKTGTSNNQGTLALQFDNIVLDGGTPVPVPEPVSLALVGIGLAALRISRKQGVRA